jgi:hypothetical protein
MRRRKFTTSVLAWLLLVPLLSSTNGCAFFTGLITGAFTGAVDAPAEVYRHHRGDMERNPVFIGFDVLLFGPLGFAVGPLAGGLKGLSEDVQWLIGTEEYGPVFGSYDEPSIWRPYTIHW